VYEARVSLERDYYQVAEAKYPLRYGMTAAVEIVVRCGQIDQRRSTTISTAAVIPYRSGYFASATW